MAKKLLSEVTATVESNLDGASGALVEEGRRLEDLFNDLQGLRPHMDDGIGATRGATINTMFFQGGLSGVYHEANRVSGAFAALIDTVGGYIGTVIDSFILEHADSLGALIEGTGLWLAGMDSLLSSDGQIGTTVTGVDGVDYIFDPILGWKESPFVGAGDPGHTYTFSMADGILELGAAIEGIRGVGETFVDNPELKRAKKAFAELRGLENLLVSDPTKTMANIIMKKFKKTEWWKTITEGG